MSEASRRRAAELGMPFGTASNRLRKMILFRFTQRFGEDVCFRCGRQIESVDDLSIEHKQPWYGVDPTLFWDLENIAFSHIVCNRPEPGRHAGHRARKIGPSGTAWCSGCQKFLSESSFGRGKRWDGLNFRCRECHRRAYARWQNSLTPEVRDRRRAKNRERMRGYMRQYREKSSFAE